MEMDRLPPEKVRKPGRPRAIPPEHEQLVLTLYDLGYGYRAIANRLRNSGHGLNPHYSSVRQTLMRLNKVRVRSK